MAKVCPDLQVRRLTVHPAEPIVGGIGGITMWLSAGRPRASGG